MTLLSGSGKCDEISVDMYLIDTNVCIAAIARKEPDASFLNKAIQYKQVVLSVISIAEYLAKATSLERELFAELAEISRILEIKISTGYLAAEFRANSKKISRIALLDCFLAAQAYENDLILVTNNTRDFPIKQIKVMAPHDR